MILSSLSAVSALTALSSSSGVAANASLKWVNAFCTFSIPFCKSGADSCGAPGVGATFGFACDWADDKFWTALAYIELPSLNIDLAAKFAESLCAESLKSFSAPTKSP